MLDKSIKNDTHRWTNHLTKLGLSKKFISTFVARMRKIYGPVGNCTCNNWGPRWIEDSEDLCCPGCFAGALKADQMMKVNGVKPVTMSMINQSQSWGFNVPKIRELWLERLKKVSSTY
jgi:hypothetical protein